MDEDSDVIARTDSPVIDAHQIRQIFFYFAILTLLLGLGGGLSSLPVTFFLKEKLHLGPQKMAVFGALTQIPTYVGFLFGFLRDRWRPFGKGDRGYMMITMPICRSHRSPMRESCGSPCSAGWSATCLGRRSPA